MQQSTPPGNPQTGKAVQVQVDTPIGKEAWLDRVKSNSLTSQGAIQVDVETSSAHGFVVLFLASLLVCGLCAGIAIAGFSSIGIGKDVLDALQELSLVAMAAGVVFVGSLTILYLLDFFWPHHLAGRILVIRGNMPVLSIVTLVVGGIAGVVMCYLAAYWYDWAPLVMSIFLCPLGLLAVQHLTRPGVSVTLSDEEATSTEMTGIVNYQEQLLASRVFWKTSALALVLVAMAVLGFWAYDILMNDDGNIDSVEGDTKNEKYALWAAPGVLAIAYLLFAVLLSLNLYLGGSKDHAVTSSKLTRAKTRKTVCKEAVEKSALQDLMLIVRWLIMSFGSLLSINYVVYSLFSDIQSLALMTEVVLAGTLLVSGAFIYYSFRDLWWAMHKIVWQHPLVQGVWSMRTSLWAKALILFGVGPLCPILALLSALNQSVRRKRGLYRRTFADPAQVLPSVTQVHLPDEGTLTPRVHAIFQHLIGENKLEVLVCVHILAVCGVTYLVATVMINVFLAWMVSFLANLDFALICVAVFLSGLGLFLLPPVPGAPIYLFGGVLLAGKGMDVWGEDIGFLLGTGICCLLGLVLKLSACFLQQKVIGERLGTNSWVRQTVGVHKPFIRAIEKILSEPGLSIGKVVILVGGPDWPTSVLAGVLRLSVFQCLLGTVPIILYIIPLTCTGSFYLKASAGELWSSMGDFMFTLTAAMTLILYALIWWTVQGTMEKYSEALTRPMEQYVDLDWMDHKSNEALIRCKIEWADVPGCLRVLFVLGAVLETFVFHIMYWGSSWCFGSFEVTDDINTLEWYGSDTSLLQPLGLLCLILSGLGFSGWILTSSWKGRKVGPLRKKVLLELDAGEAEWKEKRRQEAKAAAAAADQAATAGDTEEGTTFQVLRKSLEQEIDEDRFREQRGSAAERSSSPAPAPAPEAPAPTNLKSVKAATPPPVPPEVSSTSTRDDEEDSTLVSSQDRQAGKEGGGTVSLQKDTGSTEDPKGERDALEDAAAVPSKSSKKKNPQKRSKKLKKDKSDMSAAASKT